MTLPFPEVWDRLDPSRASGDEMAARTAGSGLSRVLLCAIDSQHRRHLLIALEESDADLRDVESRGLGVHTSELAVPGREPSRYLDITCQDAIGHPILDLIGHELLESLRPVDCRPADAVRRVLARWRRFWSLMPRSLLSRSDQLGLFGELWFLRVWLLPHAGLTAAIDRWRGPTGSRHDFEWPGRSVEVKATTSTRGTIHRINGVDQLLPPDGGDLHLFSIRLREEAGSSNTLPGLVRAISHELAADADAADRFETTLTRAGYSPIHAEEYEKFHLRVIEEGLYAVRDNFPRIVPSSFPGGVPGGIEELDYEINIGGFDHLRVARTPDQASAILL
ncbi:PD-(D/E)XK motif protein [Tundrisphaera lichenicola]|uniref:PD-(D/E)XK motif protein n=1 Tax=Tundrisphaera lichenicola TaxID=2029860 RepID=UPI003EBB0E89